jgi:(1->4)-alpha-D-glucan 1-alpha-D-glucosylmutase
VHAMIARLYAEGLIDGVRVDHIDGLSDPAGYCRKLRQRLDPENPSQPYLVVEKILLRGETLPADWGCDGTTGYDFMDEVSALQHDSTAEPILAKAWARLTGRPADFATEEAVARREIIARSFSAPLEACVRAFEQRARSDADAADASRPALRRALTEMLVHFPVYRGYGTASDRPFLEQAANAAKRSALPGDRWLIDLLARWMAERSAASTRFQQLSAPVAAKAVEDTAFYRYGPLLSRNDVGFDVGRFGWSAADFHARMQRRQAELPHALLATATHDHKHGEDMRARLAVLSERPQAWTERLARWLDRAEPLRARGMPDRADIAMLLQTIVGAWPLDLGLEDSAGRAAFALRLEGWQQKALREAKRQTDWSDPNKAYETAAHELLHRLLVGNDAASLRAELFAFVEEIAPAGAINGLAQTLLRLTVPGVPDLYQGAELWDLSLVDPDNRRPIDYGERRRLLADLEKSTPAPAAISGWLDHWQDGMVKLALISRTLALRKSHPALFAEGAYEPLGVAGTRENHLCAFARRSGSESVVVAVPRLVAALDAEPGWGDTIVRLPPASAQRWRNVLTGAVVDSAERDGSAVLAAADVFAQFPLALLVPMDQP